MQAEKTEKSKNPLQGNLAAMMLFQKTDLYSIMSKSKKDQRK